MREPHSVLAAAGVKVCTDMGNNPEGFNVTSLIRGDNWERSVGLEQLSL